MMRSPKPISPAPPAWRPPPVVVVTVVLHVLAVPAFAMEPGQWPWILLLLAANHLVLAVLVLAPRGNLLGPNIVRLPPAAAARREVSLTFDDGPDPALTPQVLDLLERHGVRASFFCIGEKAAEFPHLVEEIARRGLDGVDNDPDRVLGRLTDGLSAGDILLLHDGTRARTGKPALLTVLPRSLSELSARGLVSVPLPEAFRAR